MKLNFLNSSDKLLTNIYPTDVVPAIDSTHTTVCCRPPWILKP